MTERGKTILDFLNDQRESFLNLLKQLVKAESPSSVPQSLDKPFSILADSFSDLGFKVERIPGKSSGGQLYVHDFDFDQKQPYQMLLGHCDTVWPIGTLEEMPCLIEDNIFKGPGSYDMKAGLTMMVFALKTIKHLGRSADLSPVIFINSDEEIGSEDSEDQIKKLAKGAERVFVLEPSLDREGKIKTRRKGVGHFEITVKGKPSHAGLAPEEGISAIHGLSYIIQQLFDLNDPSKGITVNVGTIQGGERSNVIAAESKASVDVRVRTREDGEYVENAIHNLESKIEGMKLHIEGGIGRPPLEKTPGNKKLWERARMLGKEIDLDLNEGISGGASDGNITSQFTPTLDGLGAVGEGAHAYHEQIFIRETIDRCGLLCLLLLEPELI